MKKAVVYLSCITICCLLFVNSASAASAGIQGFYIWRDSLLPSLLPFFVCTYIMQNTGLPAKAEFGALAALCLISGAPSGARLLSGSASPHSRTAAILNTVSPMFVYAAFCCGMLNAPSLALPILLSQFTAAGIMLLLFPPVYSPMPHSSTTSVLKLLGEGISRGMAAMLNICGAIVFFMAVTAAAEELLPFPEGPTGAILSGVAEVSGGCARLSKSVLSSRTVAASAAFLFSFGGICVYAQSLTFCSLDPKVYFSTKLLQGSIASALAWLITPLFPYIAAVYNTLSPHRLLSNTRALLLTAGVSLTAMAAVLILGAAARSRKLTKGDF